MMRLVGAVLLALGAVALGVGAVNGLEGRVRDLRGLVSGLELLGREMGWNLTPLPGQLAQASQQVGGRAGEFFRLCAQGAEHLNGRTFAQVWQQAGEASQMRLERTDGELLEQLGSVLGRYDGERQCQALATSVERLEEQLHQALEQRRRLGRVYGTLSLTAGAVLIILFI